MVNSLYSHQLAAVEKILDNPRFLLGDEQGLGKTAVAIECSRRLAAKKILVLCPKSLILNWIKEFEAWMPGACSFFTPTKDYYIGRDVEVYIFNWDSLVLTSRLNLLLSRTFDLIIGDESHKALKNWEAKRCKNFIFYVARHTKRLLLLTGTPITKCAADLHPTLSLLMPGRIGKFKEFCERFCEKQFNTFSHRGYDYVGFKNERVLHHLLSHCSLRRTKEEVLTSLPNKIYKDVPIPISHSLMAECAEIPENVILDCIQKETLPPGNLMSLLRAVGMGKIDSFVDYVDSEFEATPVVAFATHVDVLEAAKHKLEKLGRRVGLIRGGVSAEERQNIVDAFQLGDLDVFLGNYAAASEGITLTRASNVILLEYPWSPATLWQAEDRCHRIGQEAAVVVHSLVAEGSFDSIVLESLRGKRSGIKKVIDGKGLSSRTSKYSPEVQHYLNGASEDGV